MIWRKPSRLSDAEAASVPVVASTAWQMLFHHAQIRAGDLVLVLGGNGNVGGFAVRLAHNAGARVVATASADQRADVRSLGAEEVLGPDAGSWERIGGKVDAVIDTIGGDAAARSLNVLRPGGSLVSAVSEPDGELARRHGLRAEFMLVAVTSRNLLSLLTSFRTASCVLAWEKYSRFRTLELHMRCWRGASTGRARSCWCHRLRRRRS
jgi:NADPH:quinone reductase-like Zn-dependent oxidoreductase